MEQGYLIDTNVFIDYMSEELPSPALDFLDILLNHQFYISVINKIELLGFKNISTQEEKNLSDIVKAANIIQLTEPITEKTISLRRQYSIKLPDAIIAVSAIHNDLALVTKNISDFKKIGQLKIVDLSKIKA